MQGSEYCRLHGGKSYLEKRAKVFNPKAEVDRKISTVRKQTHAAIAFAPGAEAELCGIQIPHKNVRYVSQRAEILEGWRNRELDPETWRKIIQKYR